MVPVKKKFSWPAFIVWLVLFFGVGALVYLIYYAFKPTDRCTTCEAKTLSSPPPGYVLNPNASAMYVPQEVVHRQQMLHQQQNLFAQPPPAAEMRGMHPAHGGGVLPGAPAYGAGPALGPGGAVAPARGEAWSNVSRPDRTTCPSCAHVFAIESRRPLDVECPACGTRGTLPGPAPPAPQGGPAW